jgi:hypothetical protein
MLRLVVLVMLTTGVSATAQDARPTSQQTRSPHGPLAIPCENCHTLTGWKPIRAVPEFDHKKTSYPLRGMHAKVDCVNCHTKPVFSNVGTQCSNCHADLHRGQFGANCEQCHTVLGWDVQAQAVRAHENRFPLLGAHASVECTACHTGGATGQFQGLSTQCYSCHAREFQSVTVPNHVTAGFSTTCESCHRLNSWLGATFDHSITGFPLTGAHASVECSSCHGNNNYALTAASAACSSCHMQDFQTATNPNHLQGVFSTNCQTCHTTVSWNTTTFDHNATGFPLSGAHATAPCIACHVNNNFSLSAANTACSACHLPDFQSTTNPNHVQAAFPTTCDTCHTSTSWTSVTFNHSTTGFTLTGAHVIAACNGCHVNNNYVLTAANTVCSACHLPDFQSTNNPSHTAAGFPTDCTVCHSTTNWTSGTFNHATTGFPLTGTHINVLCSSCHVNGNYSLNSTACITCHQSDYSNATTPVNHIQLGYPTTCDLCHNTVVWSAGTFNHSTTGFTLTGTHTTVVCSSCHVNNNYTSLPTDCYSCHRAVYQTTTNPNHVAAGFPTTCQACHTTTSWSGATFNHTWFPMTHGNAQSVCSTCHTNSSDYSVFQCTACHTAAQTTPNHSGVHNYVYNSTNCYQCHPQGTT